MVAPSFLTDADETQEPKRKYELPEEFDSNARGRVAYGLVIVNAFLFVRSLMFGSDSETSQAKEEAQEKPVEDHKMQREGGAALDATDLGALEQVPDDPGTKMPDSASRIPKPTTKQPLPKFVMDEDMPHLLPADLLYQKKAASGAVIPFPSSRVSVNHQRSGDRPAGAARPKQGDKPKGSDSPPPANRAPVVAGAVVLDDLLVNHSVIIALADLLQRASDPDGNSLTVRNLTASSGRLEARADGVSWVFTPDLDDISDVTFSYEVSDGVDSIAQQALLDLVPDVQKVITGTEGADRILGTAAADVIDGLGGDDDIVGREGDDVIDGGAGNDRIVGGSGNDTLRGGSGDDTIFGDAGNDVIYGDAGDDSLFGGDGDDVIFGGDGNDLMLGEDGSDTLVGESGNDRMLGGAGADILDGGEGIDTIDGGDGNDIVIGGSDDDVVDAGAGDDRIIATVDDGDDVYQGGDGTDTYDLSASQTDATVDLVQGTSTSQDTGNDTIAGVENVISGAGNDTIVGDAANNELTGGQGSDHVSGGAGDDTFKATANDGDDVYEGGEGSDTYDATATGADLIVDLEAGTSTSSETGSDILVGVENVLAGSGNDWIMGGRGDDRLEGDHDDNYLSGGAGDDRLDGGRGNDILDGGSGDDRLEGGSGDDVLIGGSGNDRVEGESGNDRIVATSGDGNDRYDGGDGIDTYDLSAITTSVKVDLDKGTSTGVEIGSDQITGFENVIGGSGDDILIASESANILSGGPGKDTFVFPTMEHAGIGLTMDHITDFAVGDKIDLSGIDADVTTDGDQRFTLIYAADKFSEKGQLRYRHDYFNNEETTVVEGNCDDDDEADFAIALRGLHELEERDFLGLVGTRDNNDVT